MGEQAATPKQPGKRRWPWQKEVVEEPLYDDEKCPYPVKPSELFKLSEVGTTSVVSSRAWCPVLRSGEPITLLARGVRAGQGHG